MVRVAPIAITCFLLLTIFLPSANAESSDSGAAFNIELTDSDGKDLCNPLFNNVVFYFDTNNDENGTIYKLKAMVTLDLVPANVVIKSDSGRYNVSVRFDGLEQWLQDAVMDVTLTSGEKVFHALINSRDNHYFLDGEALASFEPGKQYGLAITTTQGIISDIAPEDIHDIRITFNANLESGYHQVVFISEGEIIDTYVLPDNATISEIPSVSRSGYSFQGWFTPDGKEVTEGYVISPDEGDIIATAKWEADGSGGPNIIPITIGGVSLLLLATGFIIFFIKRRKEDKPPQ